jgi:hypothetical protein
MNYELISYHPIDYKEINKMQRKVDSIVIRIRNVESRLMEKKFVGGLSEWNPLVELQARLQVRQNYGDVGKWYVVLPTKDCIDLLNRLSKAKTKQESSYYLSMLNALSEPKELWNPNEFTNPKYP